MYVYGSEYGAQSCTCQYLYGEHVSTIGQRLREARERLGKNQADFGALGGVSKRAQINYEKDERKPDSDYFSRLSRAGVDVAYVLTGEKRSVYEVIRDDIVKAKKELGMDFIGEKPLTEYDLRTKAFIDEFAALDESGKEAVEAMIKALSKKTGKEGQ